MIRFHDSSIRLLAAMAICAISGCSEEAGEKNTVNSSDIEKQIVFSYSNMQSSRVGTDVPDSTPETLRFEHKVHIRASECEAEIKRIFENSGKDLPSSMNETISRVLVELENLKAMCYPTLPENAARGTTHGGDLTDQLLKLEAAVKKLPKYKQYRAEYVQSATSEE